MKSVARRLGAPSALAADASDWSTSIVARTCKCPAPNSAAHVLGVDLDGDLDICRQFREATENVRSIHRELHGLRDPGTELVLLRNCADACKVMHLLRARGPSIDPLSLASFDDCIREGLEGNVRGRIHEEA